MLSFENVYKTFNTGTVNERVALSGVSLHLPEGDFVTIVGGNGAGKSTLMNAISGVYFVDSGRITLDGENITFLPEHKRARHIGRLFQDPMKGTAPNMTIAENLALAYMRTSGTRFRIGIGKDLLGMFRERLAQLELGLEDRLKTNMGLLSGGQRQAVTLLMATICTPKLLMLDEHTAALDPATGEQVLKMTKDIIEKDKITTIMVTHNISSALELGNRTIMMDEGKVVLDISGEERRNMTVEELTARFKL
ncbi:MAG: ATP-binding cassette domain-containing protein [Oscillospiraceae bacterium]|nr:ATP-binding cassette domain-containing protein [Oscillospiraceae bacterium]MCL2280145.1 ATP-binding cassette domain-containing protein [Oscillospiraceae bacterium]